MTSVHACNQAGGSTGVSRPGRQGTGEEAWVAKFLEQQVLGVSPRCAVPRGCIAPWCQASGCQLCGWTALHGRSVTATVMDLKLCRGKGGCMRHEAWSSKCRGLDPVSNNAGEKV
jgi:hypothetical protein